MADLEYGKEIFVDDEGLVSDLEDDTIEDIEGAEAPTADTGTEQGSSSYQEDIEFADEDLEEDDDEEYSDTEDDIIDEDATTAEDEEDEPLFDNSDTLETIGSVGEYDNVLIMLVNGEPTVLGTVGGGDGQRARIEELEIGYEEVDELVATKASITDLQATNARIGTIEADYLTASDLQAEEARIDSLLAGKVDTQVLNANYLTANQISANYANLNASNITSATIRDAWVDKLMVQSGLLSQEGTIFRLDAIEVNASKITAGTLDVSRIIVSQNGHKYLVQYDDTTQTSSYVKLDGDVIEDLTITADKIVAGAITTEKLTTQNIAGTGGWINLRNGTFDYSNATTGNFIRWNGSKLYLNADNLKINNTDIITVVEDYAPTATITPTSSGATITITDSSGTTTANISNGSQGASGDDGVGITSITNWYLASSKSSGVVVPTGGGN